MVVGTVAQDLKDRRQAGGPTFVTMNAAAAAPASSDTVTVNPDSDISALQKYNSGGTVAATPLSASSGGATQYNWDQSGWILKQKLCYIPPGDQSQIVPVRSNYTVINAYNKLLFRISCQIPSRRNGMLFLSPKGRRIAYLKRKGWSLFGNQFPTWNLFTLDRMFSDQQSWEKSTLDLGGKSFPLYQYGTIEVTYTAQTVNGFLFKRHVPDIGPIIVWYAGVQSYDEFKLDVIKPDTKQRVAQIGFDAFFPFNSATE